VRIRSCPPGRAGARPSSLTSRIRTPRPRLAAVVVFAAFHQPEPSGIAGRLASATAAARQGLGRPTRRSRGTAPIGCWQRAGHLGGAQPRMAGKRIREVKEQPGLQTGRGREPGHEQSGGLFVPGERRGPWPVAWMDSLPRRPRPALPLESVNSERRLCAGCRHHASMRRIANRCQLLASARCRRFAARRPTLGACRRVRAPGVTLLGNAATSPGGRSLRAW